MIEMSLTPDAYAAKARLLQEQQGITLSGHEGKITKMGVTAEYHYVDGLLKVTILDKPFFVTTDYCEEQLKHWLGHAG